jgi:hypothetical protein
METVEKQTTFSHRSHSHYCQIREFNLNRLHKTFDTAEDSAKGAKGFPLRTFAETFVAFALRSDFTLRPSDNEMGTRRSGQLV